MNKAFFKCGIIPLCFIVLVLLLKPLSLSIDDIRKTQEIKKVVIGIPSFGFDTILADILWVKAIQYLGGIPKITEVEGAVIYKMFDRITDLDPQFTEAYKLGGLTLSVEDSEKAITLLEKGIINNKNIEWTVPYYASISAFFHLKDYKKAMRFLEIAVEAPDHPPHIDRLLATANNLAGYKEVSLDMWQDIYENAARNYEKDLAYKNLVRLSQEIVKSHPDKHLKEKAKAMLKGVGSKK